MTIGGASAERLAEIDLVRVGLSGCVEEVSMKIQCGCYMKDATVLTTSTGGVNYVCSTSL